MRTALIVIPVLAVLMSAQARILSQRSTSLQFPQIKFMYKQEAVLKSQKWDTVLAVDANPSPHLVTRALQSTDDQAVRFMLYFFTAAEPEETKLVLPFHEATGSFLSMTEDRKLVLKQSPADENSVDIMTSVSANAKNIHVADDRFFYFKNSGVGEIYNVFEAMNGKRSDYGFYVSVPGENEEPELRKVEPGQLFPGQVVFQIVDPHDDD